VYFGAKIGLLFIRSQKKDIFFQNFFFFYRFNRFSDLGGMEKLSFQIPPISDF